MTIATLSSAPTGTDAPTQAPAEAAQTSAPEAPVGGQVGDADGNQPALIGGKFKTQEDLLAAYKALESKLGAPPSAPEGEPEATPEAAQQAVSDAGLDFDALGVEYATEGDLKPESYEALAKAGIPKPMVDAYIAGQKALAEANAQQLYALAGGANTFAKMTEWAGTNLSDAEINAYNEAVTKGTPDQAKLAVSGLHARFAASEGVRPSLVTGSTTNQQVGYQSVQQMTADMNDPRYLAGDKAFHAMVDAKLANAAF